MQKDKNKKPIRFLECHRTPQQTLWIKIFLRKNKELLEVQNVAQYLNLSIVRPIIF